ncbi:gluconokinase [Arthrobacter monumenti]
MAETDQGAAVMRRRDVDHAAETGRDTLQDPGTSEGARLSVIVMGVSGSGKTTIGEQLAAELGLGFIDGDALHPAANVEKMAAGTPLNDGDRQPWLARIGQTLADAPGAGMVIACSALKQSYRQTILEASAGTFFVHLDGSEETLTARMNQRSGHFMPPGLLESQLATLEPLAAGEPGVRLSIDDPVTEIVAQAAGVVRSRGTTAVRS